MVKFFNFFLFETYNHDSLDIFTDYYGAQKEEKHLKRHAVLTSGYVQYIVPH